MLTHRSLRCLLLVAVLEKQFGPRLFLPQYALGEVYEPSRLVYYGEFMISAITLVVALAHVPLFLSYSKRNLDLFAFFAFAALHAVFVGRSISDIQFVLNYVEVFIALFLVARLDGAAFLMRVLFWFLGACVVLNAAAVVVPSLSFMQGGENAGFYRGLTRHRNDLSYVATLALTVFVCTNAPRLYKWPLIALSLILLVAAGSVQGILLTMIGCAIVVMYRFVPRRIHYRVPLVVFFVTSSVLGYLVIPAYLEEFLSFFGRDLSFTGRDRIWQVSTYFLDKMPTLGYGVGFLSSTNLPPEFLQIFGLGSVFGSAHSSYLEAALTYGWIGAFIFYLVVARQVLRAGALLFSSRAIANPIPFVLIAYCVIGGFTASEKMFLPGAGWVSFVLSKILLDAQWRTQPVPRRQAAERPAIA